MIRIRTGEEMFKQDTPPGGIYLIYGESGVGKSVSCIQSLPKKLAFIMGEERDTKRFVEAALNPQYQDCVVGDLRKDITDITYDTIEDLIELLNGGLDFSPYTSIVYDGLSYFMNVFAKRR